MNNKVIAVFVIFLLVALWDLSSRLVWDATTTKAQASQSGVEIQLPQKLTKKQQEQLAQQYLAFNDNVPVTENKPEQGMSLEEQNQQNGRLDQLFAGDLRIRLSAVIRQAGATSASKPVIFALLSVENITEASQSLQKIKVSEQFHGYKVQNIQLNKITLISVEDSNRVVTLAIYQKRSAASPESTLNRKSL